MYIEHNVLNIIEHANFYLNDQKILINWLFHADCDSGSTDTEDL